MNRTADTAKAIVGPHVAKADLKLEVVVIPVADAERSKGFYGGLGWRLDADFGFENGFRVVQFTPPGSPCSSSTTLVTGNPQVGRRNRAATPPDRPPTNTCART